MGDKKMSMALTTFKVSLPETVVPEMVPPRWHLLATFSSLCILALMVSLDATSLPVALPVVSKDLGGTAVEAFWSATSFLLASTVFQPIIGSYSHLYGRKSLMYVSLLLFFVGSVIIATGKSFTVVILGRTIQGSGGGGILCLTGLIIVDKVPLRERGKWISLVGAMWSIGTVTGPLLGGGLAKETLWRWIFWINLPLLGIAMTIIAVFLDSETTPGSFTEKLKEVDWVGMALFLPSITGVMIPITRGGIECPWDSWRTLVPLFISTAGLLVFALHQEYVATNPLIRTSVFKNLSASIVFIQTIVYGIILGAVFLYLPLYFEAVKGMSPMMAGVAIFPWTFTVAPSAMVTGIAITKIAKYRWANWLGWCLTTVGIGLLVLLRSDTPTGVWVGVSLVGGIGLGMLYPAMLIAVQASSSIENQTYSTNIFTFVRAFGQSLGIAVGGVVFQNRIEKRMLSKPLVSEMAGEYSKDAVGLVQIIKGMQETEMKSQLRESFTYALMWIWIFIACLSGFALLASFLLKRYNVSSPGGTEGSIQDEEK